MDRNTNRVRKPSRKYPIQVVIPRSRRYVRGCGPALAPLRIALKNDSTAYITGKEIWPGTANDGGLKLQLHYIVKWTDLPAAAVLVEAHRILDYVSPRILEDYEYKLSLERDAAEKEYRRKAAVARKARKAAKESKLKALQANTVPLSTNTTPSNPVIGQKKRGRPSKADVLARMKIITGEVEDISSSLPEGVDTSWASLSAPREFFDMDANKLAPDQDLYTDGEKGEGDVIDQQLYLEAAASHASEVGKRTNPTTNLRKPNGQHQVAGEITIPLHQTPRRFEQPTRAGGFTPAGRSAGKWPSPTCGTTPAARLERSLSREKAATSSRGTKINQGEANRTLVEEPVWVVQRLEADDMVEIDGEMQRYFKVRWDGDWPSDQNPTWEPETNLPEKLVREYLKKAASRRLGAKSAKKSPRKSLIRKYSSVAEAFEGDTEDVIRGPTPTHYGDDTDMEEQLLVEERERTAEPPRPRPTADLLNFAGTRSFTSYNGNGSGFGCLNASPSSNH